MSSVTFPPSVGGNGSTVTDDSDSTTGLDGGGHRTRFVPALAQVVAVAANTVTKAGEAAASAAAAASSASSAADQVGLTTAAGAAQVALAAAHVATASSQAAAATAQAQNSAASAATATTAAATATTAANTAVAVATGGATSLIASPGKIPIADAAGHLHVTWFSSMPDSAPTGAAGGVLSGTYPNPGFAADMATQAELDAHTGNTSNPHSVTKAQVGLSNVDDTSDATKNAATATLTNKTLTTPIITQNIQVISTGTTAVCSRTYILTASLPLTLPAAPAAGDWVSVVNRSGATTPVIGRNAQNIMGLAEDMGLDSLNASLTLVFADATRGWVLV